MTRSEGVSQLKGEVQPKDERWNLMWHFIWAIALIVGTVAVATAIARWVPS